MFRDKAAELEADCSSLFSLQGKGPTSWAETWPPFHLVPD